jgi:ammonium transporter Rh
MRKFLSSVWLAIVGLCFLSSGAWAGEAAGDAVGVAVNGLQQVAQYNFSIHILAMLLVGFGFLMVFLRKYGYGATTGTYLVVAVGIPLYVCASASVPIAAALILASELP